MGVIDILRSTYPKVCLGNHGKGSISSFDLFLHLAESNKICHIVLIFIKIAIWVLRHHLWWVLNLWLLVHRVVITLCISRKRAEICQALLPWAWLRLASLDLTQRALICRIFIIARFALAEAIRRPCPFCC